MKELKNYINLYNTYQFNEFLANLTNILNILEYNIIIMSLIIFIIYWSLYKYYSITLINLLCIFLLIIGMFWINEVNNIYSYYLIFEYINIIVYGILGLNSKRIVNYKASLIYYIVGFFSSISFLTGLNIISLDSNNGKFLGYSLVFISLIIKFGAFPFYGWIIPVYNNLQSEIFILFISVLKLNIINLILIFMLKLNKFINLFNYETKNILINIGVLFFIIITTLVGSKILSNQLTIKGFLAGSSIINIGIILYSIINITLYYKINNSLSTYTYIYIYMYLNIYIYLSIGIYILWLYIKKNSNSNNNLVYINKLYYFFLNYKDSNFVYILWILGGFPPFLLFILKIYILYLLIYLGNVYIISVLLLILNSVALYGYVKIMSSLLIKLKYTFNNI